MVSIGLLQCVFRICVGVATNAASRPKVAMAVVAMKALRMPS